MGKIKVLVVDDSALVRKILTEGLAKDPSIEVVGSASDPYIARDMIQNKRPDVLTLDVEMPKMDGIDFLRKLMPQYPIPVVMVSSLTQKGKQVTLEALEAGAVDFVSKPTSNVAKGLENLIMTLRTKVKIASTANVSHWKEKRVDFSKKTTSANVALAETTDKIVAIGASTGGTEAIKRVLEGFPATMPGVVMVIHMPAGFTQMYAQRLNDSCQMYVKEAENGDKISTGKALLAPGGVHMKVKRVGGEYQVECSGENKVNGHCPSVEVLFNSVATNVGPNALGVILTGMGGDGAQGLLNMKEAGSFNIAQDEKSCVIFGMPKVAIEKNAHHEIHPLNEISARLIKQLGKK